MKSATRSSWDPLVRSGGSSWVAVAALEGMLDVAFALLDEAAAV